MQSYKTYEGFCPLLYAALDAYASHLIFERATEMASFDHVTHNTTLGTTVALLIQGGNTAAYGKIADPQPSLLGSIHVQVPTKRHIVIDIETVLIPSAAVILHLLPQSSASSSQRIKAGAYTLGQLHTASSTSTFQVVAPITLLTFDHQNALCHCIFIIQISVDLYKS